MGEELVGGLDLRIESVDDDIGHADTPVPNGSKSLPRSAAAERMRRHRERRRDGLRCLTIELREIEIYTLICKGLLKYETRNDTEAIKHALYKLLDDALDESGDV